METTTVSTGRATTVLGVGTLVSHGFGLSLVPAMLPYIEAEFRSGYGVLGLAVATGLLAYAFGALITSSVMRKVPTRALLLTTFVVSGAGFLVSATATSPGAIAAAVVLLGVSAPISWTATLHVARESVSPDSMSLVGAGASGGAAVGVVVNGVLVSTAGSVHSWRVSFVVAALVTGSVVVATLAVFNRRIAPPEASGSRLLPIFGAVLADPSGRLVVATSAVSGVAVFTLATFLTATAMDEMGVSAGAAAALLWIAGSVGVASAIAMGRLGDRRTPAFAIAVAMTTYSAALVTLTIGWSYQMLVVAMIGYGVLNGPVWGLMGALANRRFSPELAIGAIALGLVAASLVGALGNSLTGLWIESTGSMRLPVGVLALATAVLSAYLYRQLGRSNQPTPPGPPDA